MCFYTLHGANFTADRVTNARQINKADIKRYLSVGADCDSLTDCLFVRIDDTPGNTNSIWSISMMLKLSTPRYFLCWSVSAVTLLRSAKYICVCVLCAETVGTCGDWRPISIIIDSDACRQAGGV